MEGGCPWREEKMQENDMAGDGDGYKERGNESER